MRDFLRRLVRESTRAYILRILVSRASERNRGSCAMSYGRSASVLRVANRRVRTASRFNGVKIAPASAVPYRGSRYFPSASEAKFSKFGIDIFILQETRSHNDACTVRLLVSRLVESSLHGSPAIFQPFRKFLLTNFRKILPLTLVTFSRPLIYWRILLFHIIACFHFHRSAQCFIAA
jgi:hypothetical protein